MLQSSRVTVMLPVVDLERARRFYGEVLGLKELGKTVEGGYELVAGGGARLALSPRTVPTKAEHTAASFEVHEIASVVRRLTERGARFEDYDLPGLKTVDKICTFGKEKAAWFKDTEGNILCVHERLP